MSNAPSRPPLFGRQAPPPLPSDPDTPPAHLAKPSEPAERPLNPWLWTIIGLSIGCGLLGLILAMNEPKPSLYDTGPSTSQMVGVGLLAWSATLFLAWLVCQALTWRPPAVQ